MDKEEHLKLMKSMMLKPATEIDEMFNSGMFNEIVLGALIATLENSRVDHKDIAEYVYELKTGTFDQYTASDLRNIYKNFKE